MSTNPARLIFEEWKASLRSKDRTEAYICSNFEELFQTLYNAGITFDEAYAMLPAAIKAHQPVIAVVKNTYKNIKNSPKVIGLSEREFQEAWNLDIDGKGTATFFEVYKRPKTEDELEEEERPKVFGSMSAKEYKTQRKHTDAFPILDTEMLERKMVAGTYDPMEDIKLAIKKDNNGQSN